MGDEPKVEGSATEPKAKASDRVDKLMEVAETLLQLKIAESEQPKPVEIPLTDPNTKQPAFTAAPDGIESTPTLESDARFATNLIKSENGLPKMHKGFTRPMADVEDRKSINVAKFPRGDYDNFSMARYAMAKQREQHLGVPARKQAPWETMYYEALEKVVVTDPITKAQGDMVSGDAGGFLAPEFWAATFYDQLYAAQIVTQLPITTVPMGYRVQHVPYLQAAISISYSSENATLATTQATFGQISFTARKQGQIVQISNELIRDSVPAADAILTNHATRWMALDRDKQMILGNGQSGAPVGLVNVNTGGTNTLTTTTLGTNASPLYTELVTGIINVETLNGTANRPIGQATCTGVLGMPALKQQILNIKDSNGRPMVDFTGLNAMRGPFPSYGGGYFDGLLGVPTWRFSQVFNETANSRHIIFGDWQWLVYMVRQDVEIMVSNVAGTSFAQDQTWIRLISRYDVGVAHPEAFFAYTNG